MDPVRVEPARAERVARIMVRGDVAAAPRQRVRLPPGAFRLLGGSNTFVRQVSPTSVRRTMGMKAIYVLADVSNIIRCAARVRADFTRNVRPHPTQNIRIFGPIGSPAATPATPRWR